MTGNKCALDPLCAQEHGHFGPCRRISELPREVFPCSGCSRRVPVAQLCEDGAYCWDCCGARHRDSPECARWRSGQPMTAERGVPTSEFISGYLAALDAVDRAIEDGEVSTLNEVRGFITEDAERMAK